MGYFPVRYDSRVVIYDCKMFIRLATLINKLLKFAPSEDKANDLWGLSKSFMSGLKFAFKLLPLCIMEYLIMNYTNNAANLNHYSNQTGTRCHKQI